MYTSCLLCFVDLLAKDSSHTFQRVSSWFHCLTLALSMLPPLREELVKISVAVSFPLVF